MGDDARRVRIWMGTVKDRRDAGAGAMATMVVGGRRRLRWAVRGEERAQNDEGSLVRSTIRSKGSDPNSQLMRFRLIRCCAATHPHASWQSSARWLAGWQAGWPLFAARPPLFLSLFFYPVSVSPAHVQQRAGTVVKCLNSKTRTNINCSR